MNNAVPLLALLGLGGLLLSASRSGQEGRQQFPGPTDPSGGIPPQSTAPPILQNGTLGHTSIPAGMFWGLPMPLIWRIDNAYYAQDPRAIAVVAQETRLVPGFEGLAQLIETDAKKLPTPKA